MAEKRSLLRVGNVGLLVGALALGFPAIFFRLLDFISGYDLSQEMPMLGSLVYGVAIMGAAFLLSWAGEAAQKDVSASLAIAVLALIALLPEYSVEAYLAWDAGRHLGDAAAVGRLAANVNGSNRLLIGLGWSLVALVFWFRVRWGLILPDKLSKEIGLLAVATLLSFAIFFFKGVPLFLGVVLLVVYLGYLALSSMGGSEEPDLEGPAEAIGNLPKMRRRLVVVGILVYAALLIVTSVEPFVHGLVDTGRKLGIDDFYLIKWLAPLASESPEMVVALLYTAKANPAAGISVLVSSGVNQLTVLVGSMPVVYSLAAGRFLSVHLEQRQVYEFLLTSAFSVFAVVLIARRRFGLVAALLMLALFLTQLVILNTRGDFILALVLLAATAALAGKEPVRLRLLARYMVRQATELTQWLTRRQPSTAKKDS